MSTAAVAAGTALDGDGGEGVDGVQTLANVSGEVWQHPVTAETHRLSGPAYVEIRSGVRHEWWFVSGKRHRLGAPAYISSDGVERWFVDDDLHRLDGPAVSKTGHPEETAWAVRGAGVEDPDDQAVLGELYAAGDVATLELVLSLWRPDGPAVLDLLTAVRAARA